VEVALPLLVGQVLPVQEEQVGQDNRQTLPVHQSLAQVEVEGTPPLLVLVQEVLVGERQAFLLGHHHLPARILVGALVAASQDQVTVVPVWLL